MDGSGAGGAGAVYVVGRLVYGDEDVKPDGGVAWSRFVGRGLVHCVLGEDEGDNEGTAAAGIGRGKMTGGRVGVLVLVARSALGRWDGEVEEEVRRDARAFAGKVSGRKGRDEVGDGVGIDGDGDGDVDVGVVLVNDMLGSTAHGFADRSAAQKSMKNPSGPGYVLVSKIAGAVADMGYAFHQVKKVAELASKNTRSVFMPTLPFKSDAMCHDQQIEAIREMLALLLTSQPADDHTAFLWINSNEPVLLFNTWGGQTRSEIKLLISQTIGQLQQDHNIEPVRVYAGENLPGSGNGHDHNKGFGVSILNVVNTEIGGPSMIQLLDFPTTAAGWRIGVSKEEWEACDGSVDRVVNLAMKNWDPMVDQTRVLDTDRAVEKAEDIDLIPNCSDMEEAVLPVDSKEQLVGPDESTGRGDETQDSEGEKVTAETAKEPAVGSEENNMLDEDPLEEKVTKDNETASKSGDGDDFEIIHRSDGRRSLIDMVLGQGKHK
jgi:hypothetical protein